MPRKSEPIRWTVDRAAVEFGIAHKTLRTKLALAGTNPGEDGRYSTKQIDAAIHDDISEERIRLTKEQADKTALQNAIIRAERPTVEAVYKTHEGIYIALRQTILASHLNDAEQAECLEDLRRAILDSRPID